MYFCLCLYRIFITKYTPLNSMTMSRINFEDEVVIFHVLLLLASLSYIFFSLTISWHKISFLKNEAYKDFSKYSNIRILKGTLLICGFNLKLPRQPGSHKFPTSNLFNPLFTPFLYSCHILCTDALLFNLQLSFDFNRNLLVWMTDKTHHQATHQLLS